MLASDNTKSSVFVCKYNTRSSQSANVDAKKEINKYLQINCKAVIHSIEI